MAYKHARLLNNGRLLGVGSLPLYWGVADLNRSVLHKGPLTPSEWVEREYSRAGYRAVCAVPDLGRIQLGDDPSEEWYTTRWERDIIGRDLALMDLAASDSWGILGQRSFSTATALHSCISRATDIERSGIYRDPNVLFVTVGTDQNAIAEVVPSVDNFISWGRGITHCTGDRFPHGEKLLDNLCEVRQIAEETLALLESSEEA